MKRGLNTALDMCFIPLPHRAVNSEAICDSTTVKQDILHNYATTCKYLKVCILVQTKQYIQVITINKCMIIEAIKGLKKQVAAVTYKQSNPGQWIYH